MYLWESNGRRNKNAARKWGLAHSLSAHSRWGDPRADRLRGAHTRPGRSRAAFSTGPDRGGTAQWDERGAGAGLHQFRAGQLPAAAPEGAAIPERPATDAARVARFR